MELPIGYGFGAAAVVLAVLYLVGVRRVPGWPRGRTVAWLVGCVVVLVAGRYAPAMFSHTLLAVAAPLLLVLGAPVTLGLRARPGGWLVALVRSRACRILTHPAVGFLLLIGPFYLLYYAGALDAALGNALNAVFLLGGYAFFWPVIGPDPGVRRLAPAARVGLMAALLVAFGFLAVVVGNANTLAGSVVWALGELPVLVLVIVVAARWARSDERQAAETEPDLTAYNAMLANLDERTRR